MTTEVLDPLELVFKEYLPFIWVYPFGSLGFSKNYIKYCNTDVSILYRIDQGELTDYQSADASKRVYEAAKEIFRNQEFWFNLFKTYGSEIETLKTLSVSITSDRNLSQLKSEEIIKYLKTIQDGTEALYPMSNMCYFFSLEFENHISDNIASLLPAHPTYSSRFRDRTWEIKKEFLSDTAMTEDLVKEKYNSDIAFSKVVNVFAEEFKYLTSINGEVRSPQSFFSDIANATFTEEQEYPSLSENQKIMAECLFYKDEISTYLIPFIKHGFMPFWEEIAKRLGITVEDLEYLNTYEIAAIFAEENKNWGSLIEKRKEFMWSYHKAFSDSIPVFQGKHTEELFNNLLKVSLVENVQANLTEIKEFTGKIGNKGRVKGTAHIVQSSADIGGFPEGAILVAVYTAPELVPIMKKASAIITDTGGIACHAAIVSRELKIPCIVGTKIATRVLKNGDLVDVDADNGIIKIM